MRLWPSLAKQILIWDSYQDDFQSVLQGPFIRWVNNKCKWYKSHLYFIFSIIFLNKLLCSDSQNTLRSWWQRPLGKTWDLQCQNRAKNHVSRKTKNRRQHALFLWTVEFMLWISNLFLHLAEVTHFEKHIDGLLRGM